MRTEPEPALMVKPVSALTCECEPISCSCSNAPDVSSRETPQFCFTETGEAVHMVYLSRDVAGIDSTQM